MSAIEYRPEIDGLRALAVLPVVLFHAGFEHFGGGFVGVDVFFVISGYLITSIIISDLKRTEFSIAYFYERRARRILPALFVVMAACVVPAWLLFPNHDLASFGKSLISVSTFTSNFLFWFETGYFETASELKPLLHTWSLAVEEQYYLVAPVLVLAMWRFGLRTIVLTFSGLLFLSLAAAEAFVRSAPEATFFLPHTRFWELMIGGLGAIISMRVGDSLRSSWASFLGLLLILAGVFLYSKETPFPGVSALVPTLGAALVLVCGTTGTFAARILGLRPFVSVGLISYSVYLWHQPVFAFARMLSVSDPEPWIMGWLVALSLFLGYLSWRLVEQPFRSRAFISKRALILFSVGGLVAFICIGLFLDGTRASRSRLTISGASFKELSQKLATNTGLGRECAEFNTDAACRTGDQPVALLWGDSYAMHLALAIKASPTVLPFAQLTKSNCGPILGVAPYGTGYNSTWGQHCIEHNERVMRWLEQQSAVKVVVMSSPFRHLSEDGALTLSDGSVQVPAGDLGRMQLLATIRRLREMGKQPVLVTPTPSPGFDIGKCLARSTILGLSLAACDFRIEDNKRQKTFDILLELGKETGVRVVRLDELLCTDSRCISHAEDIFLFRDSGHLSREGAKYLGATHDLAALFLAEQE